MNSILFYTNITSHTHDVQHLTPSTYILCQACYNQATQRIVVNMFGHRASGECYT